MRHVREVMRLKAAGMPSREISPAGGDGAFDGAVDDTPVRGGGADLAVTR